MMAIFVNEMLITVSTGSPPITIEGKPKVKIVRISWGYMPEGYIAGPNIYSNRFLDSSCESGMKKPTHDVRSEKFIRIKVLGMVSSINTSIWCMPAPIPMENAVSSIAPYSRSPKADMLEPSVRMRIYKFRGDTSSVSKTPLSI